MKWGDEGFDFLNSHCHIDRVLRVMQVKGAEGLRKMWEILGLVQGEGKTSWGYCNKYLVGVHPKVDGLVVGDKGKNEWRERVHNKRCVAVEDVGLDGNESERQREWVVLWHYWH